MKNKKKLIVKTKSTLTLTTKFSHLITQNLKLIPNKKKHRKCDAFFISRFGRNNFFLRHSGRRCLSPQCH